VLLPVSGCITLNSISEAADTGKKDHTATNNYIIAIN
jgi:hypothetical protein